MEEALRRRRCPVDCTLARAETDNFRIRLPLFIEDESLVLGDLGERSALKIDSGRSSGAGEGRILCGSIVDSVAGDA